MVRETRDQSSKAGQCGRKNAHNIRARIRNRDSSRANWVDYQDYTAILDSQPSGSQNVKRKVGSSLSNLLQDSATVDADFGEYPWQAAVLKKEEYDNVYVCGAVLIDNNHLLTATHCINKYRPEELRIRLGEWDVHTDSEFHPNLELDILKISYHPNFHSGNLYNDLAVIQLDGLVDFQRNPHISPVCLPDIHQEFSGQRCWVSGWGKDALGEEGAYQPVLKEVDVPVLTNSQCEDALRKTRLGKEFNLHPHCEQTRCSRGAKFYPPPSSDKWGD